MTSKLKCPVCDVPLTACGDLLSCPNDHCAWAGNAELWKALIQSQRDLQIAVGTLRSIGACNNRVSNLALQKMAHNALAQINHDNNGVR